MRFRIAARAAGARLRAHAPIDPPRGHARGGGRGVARARRARSRGRTVRPRARPMSRASLEAENGLGLCVAPLPRLAARRGALLGGRRRPRREPRRGALQPGRAASCAASASRTPSRSFTRRSLRSIPATARRCAARLPARRCCGLDVPRRRALGAREALRRRAGARAPRRGRRTRSRSRRRGASRSPRPRRVRRSSSTMRGCPWPTARRAEILRRAGDFEGATGALRASPSAAGHGPSSDDRLALATVLAARRLWDDVDHELAGLLLAAPRRAEVRFLVAYAALGRERYAAAETAAGRGAGFYARTIRRRGSFAASALARQGRDAEARRELEQFLAESAARALARAGARRGLLAAAAPACRCRPMAAALSGLARGRHAPGRQGCGDEAAPRAARRPSCPTALLDEIRVGRRPGRRAAAPVRPCCPGVHARLSRAPSGDGWVVEDMGSTNGTSRDGAQLGARRASDARAGRRAAARHRAAALRGAPGLAAAARKRRNSHDRAPPRRRSLRGRWRRRAHPPRPTRRARRLALARRPRARLRRGPRRGLRALPARRGGLARARRLRARRRGRRRARPRLEERRRRGRRPHRRRTRPGRRRRRPDRPRDADAG